MSLLKFLSPVENFDSLLEEIHHLISTVGFEKNQIICQTLEKNCEDWLTGVGRIDELEHENEQLYKHLNPKLKNTEIEKVIEKYNAFRTRIMIMPPRRCYSIHSDPTPRLHIPIVTNDQCWMIWPSEQRCYKMVRGLVYWADTTKNHTFINGSTEDRVHLVLCVNN